MGKRNAVLPDKIWTSALSCIHKCSINSRHRLIQFKVIHRFHYCKAMLHRFYPSVSPVCDKCNLIDATLLHSFWKCPLFLLVRYFLILLWGLPPVTLHWQRLRSFWMLRRLSLPPHIQTALLLGTVVAKKIILKIWKALTSPCFQNWLHDLVSIIHMEKLRFNKSKIR